MCTVFAWRGDIPKDFVRRITIESRVRGTQGTGLAWASDGKYSYCKDGIDALKFVEVNKDYVEKAQASFGIGHCRNASPKMPVNSRNSHPFFWKNLVYAHNGAVRNWKHLRQNLFSEQERDLITTDSMVLGPLLELSDLGDAVGSFGLVWLHKGTVHFARSKKELEAASVTWKDKDGEHVFIVACSLIEIVDKALLGCGVKYETISYDIEDGVKYELCSDMKVSEISKMNINSQNAVDAHSSSRT